ncbi:MAG TPA: hypothetical protein EYP33_07745 [Pyrodictium sp.]|nr:hypothetical protein [Pyrodictium sp.]
MKILKAEIGVPATLLGVPIPDSENPIIAAPVAKANVVVEIIEGVRCSDTKDAVEEFTYNLARGLEMDACPRARVKADPGTPIGGLYAAVTAAIAYQVARWFGEAPDVLELVELARLAEPLAVDKQWAPVIDALRLSALQGAPVVYRNEEEYSTLPSREQLSLKSVELVKPKARVSRDSLGPDPYNALIHLMGVTVLEAALQSRESESLGPTLIRLKPIHDAVALAVWGLTPRSDCIWSPGVPGEFELLC